jgi:hypothetical protein
VKLGGQVLPSASANASTTHRNELKETSKKVPPGKMIVASGTMDNEHGVFFKLKRSSAAPFEGTKLVSFRFVVPADWRGDWVVVSAQARGTVRKSLFFKSIEPCGETKAFVGLYLAGDASAQHVALELAESQALYLAGGEKEQPTVIGELAMAANPWQTARPQTGSKASPLSRTCHKPLGPGLFAPNEGNAHRVFASNSASQRNAGEDRASVLKQALNRMARLSHSGEAGADHDDRQTQTDEYLRR